jgi:hypothetical protein
VFFRDVLLSKDETLDGGEKFNQAGGGGDGLPSAGACPRLLPDVGAQHAAPVFFFFRFNLSPNRRVLLTWKADHLNLPHSGGGGMDQELVQYLDERFGRIEQRLDLHDRRFDEVNARLDDRIEEVKRHSGVLVEGLRHEIHLVAEGLAMHIQVQHVQEREYFDRKFDDTHALIRSFNHRIESLERNRPN